jgi:hypothetical protein
MSSGCTERDSGFAEQNDLVPRCAVLFRSSPLHKAQGFDVSNNKIIFDEELSRQR